MFIPCVGARDEASAATLRASLYSPPTQGGLHVFATSLFTHNSQVAIMAFALGFLFGIPTIILSVQNGAMAGAMFAAFVPHGLGWGLFAWLMIHGTNWLSSSAAGRMKRILLRSEPMAIFLIIGSSRLGSTPWRY